MSITRFNSPSPSQDHLIRGNPSTELQDQALSFPLAARQVFKINDLLWLFTHYLNPKELKALPLLNRFFSMHPLEKYVFEHIRHIELLLEDNIPFYIKVFRVKYRWSAEITLGHFKQIAKVQISDAHALKRNFERVELEQIFANHIFIRPSIQVFEYQNSSSFSPEDVKELIKQGQTLRSINVKNTRLTYEELLLIAEKCPYLQEFKFCIPQLIFEEVLEILKLCPYLESLDWSLYEDYSYQNWDFYRKRIFPFRSGIRTKEELIQIQDICPHLSDIFVPIELILEAAAYYEAPGEEHSFQAKAIVWYEKAAKQNHLPALFALGHIYEQGKGVEPSIQKALTFYRKAAQSGHPDSQYAMGTKFEEGKGVIKSKHQALVWHEKAARGGHSEACLIIGSIHPSYGKAASEERFASYSLKPPSYFSEAQIKCGYLYAEALGYRALNEFEAALCYGLALDFNEDWMMQWMLSKQTNGYLSDPTFFANVGDIYQRGLGVLKSELKAKTYYQKAAQMNHAKAQYKLGLMYYEGKGGLQKSLEKAVELLSQAANQNDEKAKSKLKKIRLELDKKIKNSSSNDRRALTPQERSSTTRGVNAFGSTNTYPQGSTYQTPSNDRAPMDIE